VPFGRLTNNVDPGSPAPPHRPPDPASLLIGGTSSLMSSSSPPLCLRTGTVRVRRSAKTRHKIPRAGRTAYAIDPGGDQRRGCGGTEIGSGGRGLLVASLRSCCLDGLNNAQGLGYLYSTSDPLGVPPGAGVAVRGGGFGRGAAECGSVGVVEAVGLSFGGEVRIAQQRPWTIGIANSLDQG
jgi:hypothetical protein